MSIPATPMEIFGDGMSDNVFTRLTETPLGRERVEWLQEVARAGQLDDIPPHDWVDILAVAEGDVAAILDTGFQEYVLWYSPIYRKFATGREDTGIRRHEENEKYVWSILQAYDIAAVVAPENGAKTLREVWSYDS